MIGGGVLSALVWSVTTTMADPNPSVNGAILFVASVIAVLFDLRPGSAAYLGLRRQVNERWVYEYRGWAYGLGFGIQLGTGVLTVVSSAQILLALLAASLAPTLVGASLIGGLIGLTRGAPVLLTSRVRSPDGLVALGRRVEAARWAGHHAVVVGGILLAALLGVSIMRGSVG